MLEEETALSVVLLILTLMKRTFILKFQQFKWYRETCAIAEFDAGASTKHR